jgi:hypothetical protein
MEQPPKTNTLAIVGLVLSLSPLIGIGAFWGSIGGIICGYLAGKQIEESAGAEGGEGLAKAALWVGVGGLALYVLAGCCLLAFFVILPAIGIATSSYY